MKKYKNDIFAANLDYQLKIQNKTQKQLADEIGISDATLCRMKNSSLKLQPDYVEAIAKNLGIQKDELFRNDIDVKIAIEKVKEILAKDSMDASDKTRYALEILESLPCEEYEKIVLLFNRKNDIRYIIFNHPVGIIILTMCSCLAIPLTLHPNIYIKGMATVALFFAGIIYAHNLPGTYLFDKVLRRIMMFMFILSVILMGILVLNF